MKTPGPTKAEPSAHSQVQAHFIGRYPARLGTVVSAVLARLLDGERLTALPMVFESSTTRLAAAIHRLQKNYGWVIDRQPITIATKDGRVVDVVEYWLCHTTRMLAREHGDSGFSEVVRVARDAQCKTRRDKEEQADKRNSLRDARRMGSEGPAQ